MLRILTLTILMISFGVTNAFAAPKLVRMAGFTPEKSVGLGVHAPLAFVTLEPLVSLYG